MTKLDAYKIIAPNNQEGEKIIWETMKTQGEEGAEKLLEEACTVACECIKRCIEMEDDGK